jgi:hypothetical protein
MKVKMFMVVLWVVTPCGLTEKYKYFRGKIFSLEGEGSMFI